MKNYVYILICCCLPFWSTAQDFDKYNDLEEVDQMLITQHMFKLLADIDLQSEDEKVGEFLSFVDELKDIKLLSTEDKNIGSELWDDVEAYATNEKLEELMRVKNDGKNIKFYAKLSKESGTVKELLMLLNEHKAEDDQHVVMKITGNIDLNKIAEISDFMNLPGADELQNVKKK